MLIDIMSQYSYLSVNVKMVKLFGLPMAAYWAELLNIFPRVLHKKTEELKTNNGFFEVDREYIRQRTSLDPADQLLFDKSLVNLGVLAVAENNPNLISVCVPAMADILTEDDEKTLKDTLKRAKVKRADSTKAKKDATIMSIKNAIVETDQELHTALCDWVEAIYASGKWLSNAVVKIFQETTKKYSESKVVQLKIIELATVHGYRDASWAINLFEKDYANGKLMATAAGHNRSSTVAVGKAF